MENSQKAPLSSSKYHLPYLSPSEVLFLSEKQRGKFSIQQEERQRQNACSFLEAMGGRIGFPRKTIAMAQLLYHRFHLFFPLKDFIYTDVALAALFVSTKMQDTLKKPRDLLAVSYAVRFPELAAKTKHPTGEIDIDTMDPTVVEQDRQKLLAIERLLLETICFNFTSRLCFPYVIKVAKRLSAPKKVAQLAWRLAVDSHRTLIPLQYPPHTVALGSIYVAALLSSFEQPHEEEHPDTTSSHDIAQMLHEHGAWEASFQCQVDDLEAIAHALIDLLGQGLQNPATKPSPRTPSSPSSAVPAGPGKPISRQHDADQLLRLKIQLRETEHEARTRNPVGQADPTAGHRSDDIAMLGRNEGTVRFMFGPPGVSNSGS
ncbi:cyclin-like protein [Schizophyllum amplum]|uniref:Cyclin-like protein n=1 Tax=Schizophyllum amplum TaxID=97359 RepID=A0A550CHD8_9AGAR|nr:cyclin-like protein [Auriculariopsis ampla]